MSWLYSQVLVEEYLGDTFLGGEQSAQSNSTNMQQAFYSHGKMTGLSRLSQSGMTFKPLTDSLGEVLLTSFQAAFHAKTFPVQEEAPGSMERSPDSGDTWLVSLTKYSPASASWKTRQFSLLEGLDEFSEIWPKWGSMQNGECAERTISPLLIKETEFGFWVGTPTASQGVRSDKFRGDNFLPTTSELVKLTPDPPPYSYKKKDPWAEYQGEYLRSKNATPQKWPTPIRMDGQMVGTLLDPERRMKEGRHVMLCHAVQMWPTPMASQDGISTSTLKGVEEGKHQMSLGRKAQLEEMKEKGLTVPPGGGLNPNWVEWLMGWPIGWTDLRPLGTARFQEWQNAQSVSSQDTLKMEKKSDSPETPTQGELSW